jgi:hypothetical protein
MNRTRLEDIPLGDVVRLYITQDGTISESVWCKETIAATVLGKQDHRNIALIGWKKDEWARILPLFQRQYGVVSTHNVRHFVADHPDYTFVADIDDYYQLIAYTDRFKVASVQEVKSIISTTRKGPFHFIVASDILLGDTIAWAVAGAAKYGGNSIQYGVVNDVEEGEDNLNEHPIIVVYMDAYHHIGMSSGAFAFRPDQTVMLIKRATGAP